MFHSTSTPLISADTGSWELDQEGVSGINGWDVSSGTNFAEMFRGARKATPAISNWNMANAENMDGMFQEARVADINIQSLCCSTFSFTYCNCYLLLVFDFVVTIVSIYYSLTL